MFFANQRRQRMKKRIPSYNFDIFIFSQLRYKSWIEENIAWLLDAGEKQFSPRCNALDLGIKKFDQL